MTRHPEYPKRIYVGGQGHTVHSEEQEEALLSGKKAPASPKAASEPVADPQTVSEKPKTTRRKAGKGKGSK